MKKLKDLSLRSRLVIAIILCILLPWVGTYIASDYFTKDVLEERAVKQSEDTLKMIEMSMKSVFDDVVYASNFIQFDTNFNRLLKSNQSIDSGSLKKLTETNVGQYLQASNILSDVTDIFSIDYVTILFENDLYYMNYSTYDHDPLAFRQELWFAELEKLISYETNWIGVHPTYIRSEQESNPYLISMARTIKGINKSNIYLIISIEEKRIREILEKFESGSDTAFFLINDEAKIYSSLNEESIGQNLLNDISSLTEKTVKYEGEDHLVVSYPFSYADLKLVSLVPYKKTIGMINTVTRTTLLIQGAFLLLFLFGLIILMREITKPITRLSLVTKSVEQGNLEVRANLSGNNDVAKLAHSFDNMLDTIEEMIEQIKEQEEDKRRAELEMLQAQINPHFLFNVLNSIRLKIRLNGDKDSAELIYALSALLRMTINRNNAFIPLHEEILIVKHYLQLMNFRHQDDIDLEILLTDEISSIEVPRFFLQPIVENAFIHGYNQREGTITIVGALESDDLLKLDIIDCGIGMDADILHLLKSKVFAKRSEKAIKNMHSFNGIGVQNVYQRMEMIYGEDFKMKIESEENLGTIFTFYIPIRKA